MIASAGPGSGLPGAGATGAESTVRLRRRARRGRRSPRRSSACWSRSAGRSRTAPSSRPRRRTRQIAGELHLSVDAVKTHLRALFEKFDVAALPQSRKARRSRRAGDADRRHLGARPLAGAPRDVVSRPSGTGSWVDRPRRTESTVQPVVTQTSSSPTATPSGDAQPACSPCRRCRRPGRSPRRNRCRWRPRSARSRRRAGAACPRPDRAELVAVGVEVIDVAVVRVGDPDRAVGDDDALRVRARRCESWADGSSGSSEKSFAPAVDDPEAAVAGGDLGGRSDRLDRRSDRRSSPVDGSIRGDLLGASGCATQIDAV